MGKDLFDNFPKAREIFEQANEAIGFSLSDLCFAGDGAELQLTANTQPAILTVSVAAFRVIESVKPDFVAGHSLGEYSALVATGVIDFADAVRTVRKRGTYMQEAVPVGVGAMAAILGLNAEIVESKCAEAADGQICSPANINSPSQVVIAGDSGAVDRACVLMKEAGAKRAIKLNVSAPFHCALMMLAQERLADDLAKLEYGNFDVPIVHNVNAAPNDDSGMVENALTQQVTSPVLWLQSIKFLIGQDVDTFIEIGPGKVLSGLVRQIDRDVRVFNIENSESFGNTLDSL